MPLHRRPDDAHARGRQPDRQRAQVRAGRRRGALPDRRRRRGLAGRRRGRRAGHRARAARQRHRILRAPDPRARHPARRLRARPGLRAGRRRQASRRDPDALHRARLHDRSRAAQGLAARLSGRARARRERFLAASPAPFSPASNLPRILPSLFRGTAAGARRAPPLRARHAGPARAV
ncbi:hypothetical protein BGLA2_2000004 [Burkholderia gladioli]|nr:hypothetical protein BGLA2_2000004 [Burkholderia gladioli]